jgi:hypothetical protein
VRNDPVAIVAVVNWAQAINVPELYALGVIERESEFDVDAIGDGGRAGGLAQIDIVHGQPPEYWTGWGGWYRTMDFWSDEWRAARRMLHGNGPSVSEFAAFWNAAQKPYAPAVAARAPEGFARGQALWAAYRPSLATGGARCTLPYGVTYRTFGVDLPGTHQGIDFGVAYGEPVVAHRAGVVTAVDYNDGFGSFVRWRDATEPEIEHLVAHLSRADVIVGEPVSVGTPLGRCGNSGRAMGAHVHLAALHGGVTVDPTRFLVTGSAVVERPGRRAWVEADGEGLFLRAGPDTGAEKVRSTPYPSGTAVTVLERGPFWCEAVTDDGLTGFMASGYLDFLQKAPPQDEGAVLEWGRRGWREVRDMGAHMVESAPLNAAVLEEQGRVIIAKALAEAVKQGVEL